MFSYSHPYTADPAHFTEANNRCTLQPFNVICGGSPADNTDWYRFFAAPPPYPPNPPPTPISTTYTQISTDQDCQGNDLAAFWVPDAASCAQACLGTPGCGIFGYYHDLAVANLYSWCWLKGYTTVLTGKQGDLPGFDCYKTVFAPPPLPPLPPLPPMKSATLCSVATNRFPLSSASITNGFAYDYSNNWTAGMVYGTPSFVTDSDITGGGMTFDGATTYVDLGTQTVGSPLSVAFWARWNGLGSGSPARWQRFFDFGSGAPYYNFLMSPDDGSGKLAMAIYNGVNGNSGLYTMVWFPFAVPVGVWVHYVVTSSADGVPRNPGHVAQGGRDHRCAGGAVRRRQPAVVRKPHRSSVDAGVAVRGHRARLLRPNADAATLPAAYWRLSAGVRLARWNIARERIMPRCMVHARRCLQCV